jgi:hypothetical protein
MIAKTVTPEVYTKLLHLPVLSDEGTGLRKFCGDKGIRQFFCFRHLINKFGAGSLIVALVRKMLFYSKIEEYYSQLHINLGIAACFLGRIRHT